jgi:hypothetical protein
MSKPLLDDLRGLLPVGRERAIPGRRLAGHLGVSYRQLQELVGELIEEGTAVGSSCNGPSVGFFRPRPGDDADWIAGTAHIRSRAVSMFARLRALESIRQREYPGTPHLFDLDGDAA